MLQFERRDERITVQVGMGLSYTQVAAAHGISASRVQQIVRNHHCRMHTTYDPKRNLEGATYEILHHFYPAALISIMRATRREEIHSWLDNLRKNWK